MRQPSPWRNPSLPAQNRTTVFKNNGEGKIIGNADSGHDDSDDENDDYGPSTTTKGIASSHGGKGKGKGKEKAVVVDEFVDSDEEDLYP